MQRGFLGRARSTLLAVVGQDAIPSGDPRVDSLPLGVSDYSLFTSDENPDAPLAIPTGGGQLEAKLLEATRGTRKPSIRFGYIMEIASLVIDGQARAVLPDVASRGFRRMDWIKQAPYPALKGYSRAWCLAWNKHQMDTRGISQGSECKFTRKWLSNPSTSANGA